MKLKFTGTKPWVCPHGIRTFYPGQVYDGVPRPLGELLIGQRLAQEVKPAKPKPGKAGPGGGKGPGPDGNKASGPDETK